MPRGKKKESADDTIFSVVKELTSVVKELSTKVESLEHNAVMKVQRTIESPAETTNIVPSQPPTPEMDDYKFPIPSDHRKIIGEVLNQEFGIQEKPLSNIPAFEFTIVVPEKYSQLTSAEKRMLTKDWRTKVIDYASGNNGVKIWAENVFNNFKPEMKAQIVADRIQLVSM